MCRPLCVGVDPEGKSWWSLAGKFILKRGDIAATTAGITEDAATVADSSQPVLTRVGPLLPSCQKQVPSAHATLRGRLER